jgi:hypothetical protein
MKIQGTAGKQMSGQQTFFKAGESFTPSPVLQQS